jgi:TonB family protein
MNNLRRAFAVALLAGSIYLIAQTQDQPPSSSQPTNPAPNSTPPAQNDHSPQGGSRTTPPHAIFSPNPDYTAKARMAGIEGLVGLQLTVTEQGKAEDVKVIKTLDPELDANAVRTVRTWKFRPATKDGQPTAVQIKVTVSFQLYKQR